MAKAIKAVEEVVVNNTVSEKEPVNLVILVDRITTGKMENGIFTLNYRKKPVVNPLFPLKSNKDLYQYDYHFDMSDMKKWSTFQPMMFAYGTEDASRPEEHNNLTLSSWAELMKFYMWLTINEGSFNTQKTAADGTVVNIQVEWKGDVPELSQLKYITPKKERKQPVSRQDLEGLDFFS